MSSRRQFASLVVLLLLLIVATSFNGSHIILLTRNLFGLFACFMLPGLIVKAMWSAREHIEPIEQILTAIFVSICMNVLGALIIYTLGIPVTALGWLLCWILVIAVIAFVRLFWTLHRLFNSTKKRNITKSFTLSFALSAKQITLVGLLLLVIGLAFSINMLGVQLESPPAFTMLWLKQNADGANVREQNATDEVQIGIHNLEGSDQNYRVEFLLNGTVVTSYLTGLLHSGEYWERSIALSVASPQVAELRLYKQDFPQNVYRQVRVWLTESVDQDLRTSALIRINSKHFEYERN